jgi:clan AA aspartic protease (TIGR02281 family)
MRKGTIVTALLIFAGVFQNVFGQTIINMQKEGGVFTIPCTVNGLKLKFIFDTGASDVSISLTEALFMLKNGYLKSEDIVGKEYYQDATGKISAGTKIIIRNIEFSGLYLKDVEASVVNELSAPLLLGQSAMAKLGKFQLDPNNGQLTIINGATNNSSATNSSNNIHSNNTTYKTYKMIGAPNLPNESQYEVIGSLNEGLAVVKKNGLYGYVDVNGSTVIPFKYIQGLCFMNGVAEVIENVNGTNVMYFIDKNGNKTKRTYSSN